jgi:hypothetical protein
MKCGVVRACKDRYLSMCMDFLSTIVRRNIHFLPPTLDKLENYRFLDDRLSFHP